MFTGLIEELGTVTAVKKIGTAARISIKAPHILGDVKVGDSIAVNGVCLTAVEFYSDSFSADVSDETLKVSTLGSISVGTRVNLERAVTPQTRLGGHIVLGHVDSQGKFLSAVKSGDFWTVRIGFKPDFAKYLIYKGSVAVEGISLTVARMEREFFEIALIPKTWEMTNLSHLKSGDYVNLEADVIGKYVERMLQFQTEKSSSITKEKLSELGFLG